MFGTLPDGLRTAIRRSNAIIVMSTTNFFCRLLIITMILIQNIKQLRTDIEYGDSRHFFDVVIQAPPGTFLYKCSLKASKLSGHSLIIM